MNIPRLSLALLIASAIAPHASAEAPRVMIRGNGTDLGPTPVVVAFEADVEEGSYVLQPEGPTSPPLGAHVFRLGGRRYLGLVLDRLGADETRAYRLQSTETAGREALTSPPIRIVARGAAGIDELRVLVGSEPFATLRKGERKPYFWPVVGPTGQPITRAYPMEDVEGEDQDHPHQRSMWFTHGDVNGWDFWASDPENRPNPKFGTIKQTGMNALSRLGVGVLHTTDDWIGGDGKKVCEDERLFVFTAAEGVRFIDVDVTIRATEGPVTFGDTKEGTFGLRLASSMNVNRKPGGHIVNAEGITDSDAWGKPSAWVDYTGPVDGTTVGVAILDHPENLRHPTTWHVRDYGLFAANPFGYHDFGVKSEGAYTIPAGGTLRFRYRVVLHEGDTEQADIAAAYQGFAKPPAVMVQAD